MPLPCGHDPNAPVSGCVYCKLAEHPFHRHRWLGLGSPDDPLPDGWTLSDTRPPAVCRHRGDLVPLERRYELGLGTVRQWYPCAKGHGQNGYVCPCGGVCGTGCPDYEAGSAEEDE